MRKSISFALEPSVMVYQYFPLLPASPYASSTASGFEEVPSTCSLEQSVVSQQQYGGQQQLEAQQSTSSMVGLSIRAPSSAPSQLTPAEYYARTLAHSELHDSARQRNPAFDAETAGLRAMEAQLRQAAIYQALSAYSLQLPASPFVSAGGGGGGGGGGGY